ncbi:MAG: hypothetical protein QXL86_00540 [Candidatus Aenigmatarchaeota archaeon]
MEYWNKEIETINQKDLMELQTKKLKNTLIYVYEKSRFYRRIMNDLDITPVDISSNPWKVFEKMPITTKEDIIKNPSEFVASRWRDVYDSSGSSGLPRKTIYKSSDDWEVAAELGARTFIMFGVDENNLVMSFMPYGKFAVSGFATKMGADKANIPLISSTSFIPDEAKIYDIIKYKPDAIVNFPTKHLFLGKLAQKMGIDLEKICGGKPIKKLFMGGEPSNYKLKEELLELWKAEDYGDIIGTTEVRGVNLAADCKEHVGMHVWEDHNLEIPMKINFRNDGYEILNEPVNEGEFGADTYTTLLDSNENCAFPLVKYHHGDCYKILGRDCACGRTHMIISYPQRIDKAIIEGGVKFFEDEIEAYLYSSPFNVYLGEWQMFFYKNPDGTYPKEILIENINNIQNTEEVCKGLKKYLFDVFLPLKDSQSLFPLEVKLVEKGSLDLGRGKPKRFVKKY